LFRPFPHSFLLTRSLFADANAPFLAADLSAPLRFGTEPPLTSAHRRGTLILGPRRHFPLLRVQQAPGGNPPPQFFSISRVRTLVLFFSHQERLLHFWTMHGVVCPPKYDVPPNSDYFPPPRPFFFIRILPQIHKAWFLTAHWPPLMHCPFLNI